MTAPVPDPVKRHLQNEALFDTGGGRNSLDPIRLAHWVYRLMPQGVRQRLFAKITHRLSPRPHPEPLPAAGGVILAGEFSLPTGVGGGARLMRDALIRLGFRVWCVDVSGLVPGGDRTVGAPELDLIGVPAAAPVILHVNPDVFAWTLLRLDRRLLGRRVVVGFWAWELEVIPSAWRPAFELVHEVWTPSRFTAGAIRRAWSGPVRHVPHPIGSARLLPSTLDRCAFGLPKDRLIVLSSFSLGSSPARKNPEGTIAAFRHAFGDSDSALLVLKVSGHRAFPDDLARLRRHTDGFSNIVIELRTLDTADNLALTENADIVLSLHRSEGFGLVPAEAMALGVPVVSTDWSATAEYIDSSCAVPIPYRLVPTQDPRGVYELPGSLWAEPDIEAAANALVTLAADAALRQRLGRAGQIAVASRLSDAGIATALDALGLRTAEAPPPAPSLDE